jgi:hypothetical protein
MKNEQTDETLIEELIGRIKPTIGQHSRTPDHRFIAALLPSFEGMSSEKAIRLLERMIEFIKENSFVKIK